MMGFDAINYLFYPQYAANKDLKKAMQLIKQGKYDDAIKVLTTAIHLVPEDGYLYANRGAAYHHKKEYAKAILDYSAALERTIHDLADLYTNRGVAHAQKGDDKAAIDDYTIALRLGLDRARAIKTLEHRGYLLTNQKEWVRAENNFRELLGLAEEPNYAAQVGIAYVLLNLKDYKTAIEHFTHAIIIEPQKGYAFYNRGLAYFESHNWRSALTDFEEAFRLNPASAAARNNCGAARIHLDDLQGAQSDFEAALALEADLSYAYSGLSDIHFLRGEFELALEKAQKAYELAPERPGIYASLAIMHHAVGQVERAVEIWRELIAKDEHYWDVEWVKQEHIWPEPLVEEARRLVAHLEP